MGGWLDEANVIYSLHEWSHTLSLIWSVWQRDYSPTYWQLSPWEKYGQDFGL